MLSKSRFVAGLQCPKLLWLLTHERDAPELTPDPGLKAIFDQGSRVGELARARFPGGVLISNDGDRVDATREAIAAGAAVLYEASFSADDTFAAVDILQREPAGWRLIEVKSTLSVKDQHIPDAAVQVHVVERAGLPVHAVEIMHLNRDCRHPNLSNLFTRTDVAARVRALLPTIPARIAGQLAVLAGPLPVVATGPHCESPYPCPFQGRCFPSLPEHHVSSLYRGGSEVEELLASGIERIEEIAEPLEGIRERQRRAVQSGQVVVEGDLAGALARFLAPVAFLDFETVSPAVPCWPGCGPYETVPAQFSIHVERGGGLVHHAWLAEGPGDSRRALALALLDGCLGAATVVAYNAGFERGCITHLAAACPDLATDLTALAGRLVDLLPVVREHVYHPDFHGSFGLKAVAPALTGHGYDDLDVAGGDVATASLAQMLFEPMDAEVRAKLRADLLAYCERDTWVLRLLLERLRELASASS
jgi:hypothetical protein